MNAPYQDDLTLISRRLRSGQEWTCSGQGIWFVVVRAGCGMFHSSCGSTPLASGDALVTRAVPAVTFRASKPELLVLEYFSLQPEHLMPLLRCEELCLLQTVTDTFRTPRHYAAATPVAEECRRLLESPPERSDMRRRSHLLCLATVVLSEEFNRGRFVRSGFIRMDEHVAQILERLTAEDILSLSVGELAEQFSCSRRHLNRLFNDYFGLSVIALKMEMRLLKAASLLRDPDAKVLLVAEQSGFNHLGLFNTCFKRRFGVSPGEWRKRWPQAMRPPAGFLQRDSHCWLRAAGLCAWNREPSSSENPRQ